MTQRVRLWVLGVVAGVIGLIPLTALVIAAAPASWGIPSTIAKGVSFLLPTTTGSVIIDAVSNGARSVDTVPFTTMNLQGPVAGTNTLAAGQGLMANGDADNTAVGLIGAVTQGAASSSGAKRYGVLGAVEGRSSDDAGAIYAAYGCTFLDASSPATFIGLYVPDDGNDDLDYLAYVAENDVTAPIHWDGMGVVEAVEALTVTTTAVVATSASLATLSGGAASGSFGFGGGASVAGGESTGTSGGAGGVTILGGSVSHTTAQYAGGVTVWGGSTATGGSATPGDVQIYPGSGPTANDDGATEVLIRDKGALRITGVETWVGGGAANIAPIYVTGTTSGSDVGWLSLLISTSAGVNKTTVLGVYHNTVGALSNGHYRYGVNISVATNASDNATSDTIGLNIKQADGGGPGRETAIEIAGSSWLYAIRSNGGHVKFADTNPTLSSCGSSPAPAWTMTSSDVAGTVTTGGTAPTACTITFAEAWLATPKCVLTMHDTAADGYITAKSTTAITVSFALATVATAYAQKDFSFHCFE